MTLNLKKKKEESQEVVVFKVFIKQETNESIWHIKKKIEK